MRTPTIVVAVDGTEPSKAAVRWAAREAQHSNLPLLVLHVMDWDWAPSRHEFGGREYESARRIADGIAARAAREAAVAEPGVRVEADVLVGHPAAQLISESGNAELLVMGNRGRGGFAGLRVGSVSQRVATHAHCPVVVVRGEAAAIRGPVAVGVAAGSSADQVLEAAFTEAHRLGTSLVAVRSFVPDLPSYWGHLPPAQVHAPALDCGERSSLDEQLAPWRTKFPEVPVETLVSHETAAALLVRASHGAQLVVAGSRGHGLIAGALLGSTVPQLLHHADCPVMVVRPREKAAA